MLRRFNYSVIGIALMIMLTSFITGCGEDDDPVNDPTILSTDYVPIEVGNSWTFIDAESPLDSGTISITGTRQLADGKTVYIAVVTFESSRHAAFSKLGYLSQATNDLLLFHETLEDLEGDLVYKPPIRVGVKWEGENRQAEVVAQETVSTPAGVFQNCFRLNAQIEDKSGYYSIWLAIGVGPVKMEYRELDYWEEYEELENSIVLTSYNIANSVATDQNPSRF